MVCGSPPREIALPSTFGSRSKRSAQSLWLSTATRGPPGRSSSGLNVRPSTVEAPNSPKNSRETRPERSCSGKVPPVKLTTPVLKAETASVTVSCSRKCWNFAGEA